jgi:hypothetical protein
LNVESIARRINALVALKKESERGTSLGDLGKLAYDKFDGYMSSDRQSSLNDMLDYVTRDTENLDGDRNQILVVADVPGSGKSHMLQKTLEGDAPQHVLRIAISFNDKMATNPAVCLLHCLSARVIYAYFYGYPKQRANDAIGQINEQLEALEGGHNSETMWLRVLAAIEADFARIRRLDVEKVRTVLLVDEAGKASIDSKGSQSPRDVHRLVCFAMKQRSPHRGAIFTSLTAILPALTKASGSNRTVRWLHLTPLDVGSDSFQASLRTPLLSRFTQESIEKHSFDLRLAFGLTGGHPRSARALLESLVGGQPPSVKEALTVGVIAAATDLARTRIDASMRNGWMQWLAPSMFGALFVTKVRKGRMTALERARRNISVCNASMTDNMSVVVPCVSLMCKPDDQLDDDVCVALRELLQTVGVATRASKGDVFERMWLLATVLKFRFHALLRSSSAVSLWWPCEHISSSEAAPTGDVRLFAGSHSSAKEALFPHSRVVFSPNNDGICRSAIFETFSVDVSARLGIFVIDDEFTATSWRAAESAPFDGRLCLSSCIFPSLVYSTKSNTYAIDALLLYKTAGGEPRVLMFQMKMGWEKDHGAFGRSEFNDALGKVRKAVDSMINNSGLFKRKSPPLRALGIKHVSQVTVCFPLLHVVTTSLEGGGLDQICRDIGVQFHVVVFDEARVRRHFGPSFAQTPFLGDAPGTTEALEEL